MHIIVQQDMVGYNAGGIPGGEQATDTRAELPYMPLEVLAVHQRHHYIG